MAERKIPEIRIYGLSIFRRDDYFPFSFGKIEGFYPAGISVFLLYIIVFEENIFHKGIPKRYSFLFQNYDALSAEIFG